MKLYIEIMDIAQPQESGFPLFHTELEVGPTKDHVVDAINMASSNTNLLSALNHLFMFASDSGILPTIQVESRVWDRFDVRNMGL